MQQQYLSPTVRVSSGVFLGLCLNLTTSATSNGVTFDIRSLDTTIGAAHLLLFLQCHPSSIDDHAQERLLSIFPIFEMPPCNPRTLI